MSPSHKEYTPVIAVIPARYGSTRFPGKPLATIAGKPMIQHVYERADAARTVDRVLVATDDTRIHDAVRAFGGNAVMTADTHATGTDRIAEAVAQAECEIVINVQGDEPLIPATVLDDLVELVRKGAPMATAAVPFAAANRDPNDPNAVKVVVDTNGRALYFSRACIPFPRQGGTPVDPLLHWGVYAYRRETLRQFVAWPQTALETCEMLEQLRALENGVDIRVLITDTPVIGVDTPHDIARVEDELKRRTSNA